MSDDEFRDSDGLDEDAAQEDDEDFSGDEEMKNEDEDDLI